MQFEFQIALLPTPVFIQCRVYELKPNDEGMALATCRVLSPTPNEIMKLKHESNTEPRH